MGPVVRLAVGRGLRIINAAGRACHARVQPSGLSAVAAAFSRALRARARNKPDERGSACSAFALAGHSGECAWVMLVPCDSRRARGLPRSSCRCASGWCSRRSAGATSPPSRFRSPVSCVAIPRIWRRAGRQNRAAVAPWRAMQHPLRHVASTVRSASSSPQEDSRCAAVSRASPRPLRWESCCLPSFSWQRSHRPWPRANNSRAPAHRPLPGAARRKHAAPLRKDTLELRPGGILPPGTFNVSNPGVVP